MSKYEHAWSLLDGDTVSYISSARMDIACILENEDHPPPVMFGCYTMLEEWAHRHGMTVRSIGNIKRTSAVHIGHFYHSTKKRVYYGYGQIWARASYTGFNKAMKKIAKNLRVENHHLVDTHADHIINRSRLREIPNAWVVIFPVHKHANSPFGRIEKSLPRIAKTVQRIDLPPLLAFKLFCGKLPKTESELEHAMSDVRGQLMDSLPHIEIYCKEMEQVVRNYMRAK